MYPANNTKPLIEIQSKMFTSTSLLIPGEEVSNKATVPKAAGKANRVVPIKMMVKGRRFGSVDFVIIISRESPFKETVNIFLFQISIKTGSFVILFENG